MIFFRVAAGQMTCHDYFGAEIKIITRRKINHDMPRALLRMFLWNCISSVIFLGLYFPIKNVFSFLTFIKTHFLISFL